MAQVTVSALGFSLDATNIIIWLIVGLIAGFLASRVMRGGGYGLVGISWWGSSVQSWVGFWQVCSA